MEAISEKLSNLNTTVALATAKVSSLQTVDEQSERGRFGWITIAENPIPYIIRNEEKYCAVSMVETEVLHTFLKCLHQDIYNIACIQSYYMTQIEVGLLNEINFKHSDSQFGNKRLTPLDVIVRVSDVIELYNYLKTCYTILLNENTSSLNRCGFISINDSTWIAYTVHLGEKYVPLFYFEDESNSLKLNIDTIQGWDLAYLKFCCKIQGIRDQLFCHDTCSVLKLNSVKKYFPPDTLIKDCWPSKILGAELLIPLNKQNAKQQWFYRPTEPPVLYLPSLLYFPTINNENDNVHIA